MPLPLLFIGIAAVTGATGAGATVKAGVDHSKAKKINANSEERIAYAVNRLNVLREQCGDALQNLGKEKLFVLSGSIAAFLDTFSKIKNVDFGDSEGLWELSKFHVDETTFEEIGELGHFAVSLAAGSVVGAAGGALTALGAASVQLYQTSIDTTWSGNATNGYTKTVTISGMKATDVPVVGVVLSSDKSAALLQGKAFACINRITTASNSITLYAYNTRPSVAISIQMLVIRGF